MAHMKNMAHMKGMAHMKNMAHMKGMAHMKNLHGAFKSQAGDASTAQFYEPGRMAADAAFQSGGVNA